MDLNPALEDILSMWGKDTTAQNVEHFFGVQKLAESVLQQSAVLPPFLHQGEVTASENVQVHEQDVHVRAYENAAAKGPESGFTAAGHKGKSVVTWNPSSAGFGVSETLGRFSGSFQGFSDGGVPPLTRVSLPKDTRATRVSLPGDCEEFLGAGEGGTRTGEDLSSGKSAQGFFVGGPTNFQQPHSGIASPVGTSKEGFVRTESPGVIGTSDEDPKIIGGKRKTPKQIGTFELRKNLVLGMEVSIEETLEVADCTIVGRARGKKFTPADLQSWGEERFNNGSPLRFEARSLVKGWFMLRFEEKAAADWVLGKNWFIGKIPVLLKRWTPLFDAIKESTEVFPVWVRAPGLPFFLWTEAVFQSIGNTLGTFLEADMSFIETKAMGTARILTNLDLSKGLAKTIPLQYKDYVFEQILDYEHLPFRCHICHDYGHLANHCPLLRRRRRFRRTAFYRETRNIQHHDSQEKEDPMPQNGREQVSGDARPEEAVADHQSPEVSHVVELQSVDAAVEAEQNIPPAQPLPSEEATGKCTIPHNLSSQDLDQSNLLPHDIQTTSFPPLANQSGGVVSEASPYDPESLSGELPFPDLKCAQTWPPLTPPAQNVPCPYNLRSMGIKHDQSEACSGLGHYPSLGPQRGKRGRKSDLSKAKLKAKIDVADGKQFSIPGVLRAVQTPEPVKK